MFRLIRSLFSSQKQDWQDSLRYHARRNRHQNALDPMHFDLFRSEIGEIREHDIPRPTSPKDRRGPAAMETWHGQVFNSIVDHVRYVERKNKAWLEKTNSTVN